MKTQEFLNILKEHGEKELLFEYKDGTYVGANYHITEVKNTTIKSVDCGGRSDDWNETIIQLWESPKEIDKVEYMTSKKALSILEKVDKIHKIDKGSQVFFEYSNELFHKANLEIHNVKLTSDKTIIQLFVSQTDCKAKDAFGAPSQTLVTADDTCCSGSACC
ncbi:MAG: DUF6428 family protein [Flavobacteriaceae bacterium]|nr:DUF6428 family protein [Flavobacteriaceae bacterium]